MGKMLYASLWGLDIRLNGLFCSIQNETFRPPWRSDLGSTRPRMVEGRIMQEQLSRMPELRITLSSNPTTCLQPFEFPLNGQTFNAIGIIPIGIIEC